MANYREVVICDVCEGSGKIDITERYDETRRYEDCRECLGSGRLLVETTITPYKP